MTDRSKTEYLLSHSSVYGYTWRYHDLLETKYRVWSAQWAGVQFEILTEAEFRIFEFACKERGFTLRQAED